MSELRNSEISRTARFVDPDLRGRDLSSRDTSAERESLRDESASEESRRFLNGAEYERTAPVSPRDPDRTTFSTETQANPYTRQNADSIAQRDTVASSSLFPEDELQHFRARWDQVQASFVDKPRDAVEAADTLVENVVKRIAEQFAEGRSRLEDQWERGENVSTEDLRQGFRRYRFLFDRLLTLQPNEWESLESTHSVIAGR